MSQNTSSTAPTYSVVSELHRIRVPRYRFDPLNATGATARLLRQRIRHSSSEWIHDLAFVPCVCTNRRTASAERLRPLVAVLGLLLRVLLPWRALGRQRQTEGQSTDSAIAKLHVSTSCSRSCSVPSDLSEGSITARSIPSGSPRWRPVHIGCRELKPKGSGEYQCTSDHDHDDD